MNKKQAAEYLGKSVRSVADYVKQGKLKLVYVSGKNGKEASFDPDDLAQFKTEMEKPIARPIVQDHSQALVPVQQQLVSLLQGLPLLSPGLSLADLNIKPILSISEIQRLTGIPRDRLMSAINDGSLPAQLGKMGRGWRVKRKNLDAFIEAL